MSRIVQTTPPPPPEVTPAPDIVSEVTPAGAIRTAMPDGADAGITWDKITAYDASIHAEADPVGWPIERVRGHIVIESLGNPKAVQRNDRNGWSYGLMQVVPYGVNWVGWNKLVKQKAGLPNDAPRTAVVNALYDPAINIACGVAILESFYQQYGTLDQASSAFFLGNPNWDGQDTVNGNTGDAYKRSLGGLISEQRGVVPKPKPVGNLLDTVMGGAPYWIVSEFAVDSGNGLYGYGVGHCLNGRQHTGIDLGADPGTPLYSPIEGVVVCAGTNNGQGAHNSSCAAFNDYYGHGAGRVEVMTHDGGASLIFGHCSEERVRLGDTVTIGQQVATVGGMNSWHCHLEARVWTNDWYCITDPRAVFSGGTLPTRYAERLDWLPKPSEWGPVGWTVDVIQDGVPLLQRANHQAAEVASPFQAGDDFEAVALVWAEDEPNGYWITSRGTRVPATGTRRRT